MPQINHVKTSAYRSTNWASLTGHHKSGYFYFLILKILILKIQSCTFLLSLKHALTRYSSHIFTLNPYVHFSIIPVVFPACMCFGAQISLQFSGTRVNGLTGINERERRTWQRCTAYAGSWSSADSPDRDAPSYCVTSDPGNWDTGVSLWSTTNTFQFTHQPLNWSTKLWGSESQKCCWVFVCSWLYCMLVLALMLSSGLK